MRDLFTYGKTDTYPHMSRADTEIWERFLDKYPQKYENCQYDFHVGSPPPFNTLMDDGEDRNQDMLYRRRIDVVAHNMKKICVIEVKPKATMSTVGQLKGYKMLYMRDETPNAAPDMAIVTDQADNDMVAFAKSEGVEVYIV